ncbi:MAG: TetR/AcrR family transcriptional regulator [Chloroflexi bacterium]|nr:MAG: TetR/AcrR family transcriptional regulator [Chloroflexota bacterium]MBL1197328.1 TetR/AcrR family transcriptional regulator [Chloroflexota bacterium]NOH14624.1 TetR/AcrR family transcriptional regulator [Chloroflexota bacterium]
MTQPTRRQIIREETTQEILDTARAQMAERGAAALSLRAIAREMGMTAPAIYRYFTDRDALVTALIGQAYESLRQALEEAHQQNLQEGARKQLLAVGMAYREWGVSHPAEYALIFGTPIPNYHAPEETTVPLARSALGVLINVIQEGLQSGELRPLEEYAALSPGLREEQGDIDPQVHLALALWGHVHGLTSLELYNHLQSLVEDPAELFRLELLSKVEFLFSKDSKQ